MFTFNLADVSLLMGMALAVASIATRFYLDAADRAVRCSRMARKKGTIFGRSGWMTTLTPRSPRARAEWARSPR